MGLFAVGFGVAFGWAAYKAGAEGSTFGLVGLLGVALIAAFIAGKRFGFSQAQSQFQIQMQRQLQDQRQGQAQAVNVYLDEAAGRGAPPLVGGVPAVLSPEDRLRLATSGAVALELRQAPELAEVLELGESGERSLVHESLGGLDNRVTEDRLVAAAADFVVRYRASILGETQGTGEAVYGDISGVVEGSGDLGELHGRSFRWRSEADASVTDSSTK